MKGKVKCGSHCKCTIACSNKDLADKIDPKIPDMNSTMLTDQTIDLINASVPDITIGTKNSTECHEIIREPQRITKMGIDAAAKKSNSITQLQINTLPSESSQSNLAVRKTPELGVRRKKSIFPSPLADKLPASDLSNSFSTKGTNPI